LYQSVRDVKIVCLLIASHIQLSFLLTSIRFMYCACFFIYKHMKFRIQARLCLAICDFVARNMLSLCLTFQDTRLLVWENFNSNAAAKCEYVFSDFYWCIILVKGTLVSLANACISIGLIKFKEKNLVLMTQIKAGRYA